MTEGKRNLILTEDEKLVCEQLAVGGTPFGQRAQALLVLDSGATQELASQHSGLTLNQVRYWQGRFRTRRLDVFPDDLLMAARTEIEISASVVMVEVEKETAVKPSKQENSSTEDQSSKKSKKKKKSTGSKKDSKKKSAKKSKSKKTNKKKSTKKTKKKGKKKKSGKKSKKADKKKSRKKSKKKK